MEQPNNIPKHKTRKVSEIIEPRFVLFFDTPAGRVERDCNPSREDIEQAITSGDFEVRNFHSYLEDFRKEWASEDPVESCRRARTNHARRIAHFVVNGW